MADNALCVESSNGLRLVCLASLEAAIDSSADTTKTMLLLVDVAVPRVPVVAVVAVVDCESVRRRGAIGGCGASFIGVWVEDCGFSLAGGEISCGFS